MNTAKETFMETPNESVLPEPCGGAQESLAEGHFPKDQGLRQSLSRVCPGVQPERLGTSQSVPEGPNTQSLGASQRGIDQSGGVVGAGCAKPPKLHFASAQEVRAFRVSRRIRQTVFWSRIGVTQSTASRHENGQALPLKLRWLLNIAWRPEAQARALVNWLRGPR